MKNKNFVDEFVRGADGPTKQFAFAFLMKTIKGQTDKILNMNLVPLGILATLEFRNISY